MPFHIYKETKSGQRDKFVDHHLYPVLHDSPNAYMTSMEFRENMERSFCLYGNAYAEKAKLGSRVVALNWLRPEAMRPQFLPPDYNRLVYRYSRRDGMTEDYDPEQILHVKNFSSDGIVGESPLLRFVMQHALNVQAYSSNFLLNGGRPPGYLKFKGKRPANEEVNNKIRADWQAIHGGPENAGKTGVLWEDGEYVPIFVPPEEAQLIEIAMKLTGDIAGAIYGVPLNMIGTPDKTATYASAEQFDIQFVKHTVRPQCVRYEQAFNKALFATEPGVFCEFDLDGLQRGDSTAQATYFSTLTTGGIMDRDEARRKLNLPERGNGAAKLTVQTALTFLDDLGKEPAVPASVPAPVKDSGHTVNVVTLSKENMGEAVAAVVAGVSAEINRPKRKKMAIVRDTDGKVIGAEVMQ